MKILITGSAGFLGSNLMRALKKEGKHKLLGVDKKFGTDIADFVFLFKVVNQFLGKPDLIVHLAANTSTRISVKMPNKDFRDNVVGTFNIAEVARVYKSDVIYASTRKVLHAPYGVSKYVGELYLQEYKKTYGVRSLITRLGNVYGPGQQGSQEAFWLAWFIKASIERVPVTIYGWDGKQTRDMLYIDDCIRLLMDQINHFDKYHAAAQGEPLEAGGGKENEISLMEALKILEYDNYIMGDKLPGDVEHEVMDNTKISAINGWNPEVSIADGMKKTIESYKEMKAAKAKAVQVQQSPALAAEKPAVATKKKVSKKK